VQDKDKAVQAKEEQNIRATRHQETAIKIMIEKEKADEVTGLVSKSPQGRTTQEKLKSLDISRSREELKEQEVAEN